MAPPAGGKDDIVPLVRTFTGPIRKFQDIKPLSGMKVEGLENQPRRRAQMVVHRAAFAGDLCGGNRRVGRRTKVNVLIPSVLRSYAESSRAEANDATLADMLADLDRQYPGIRFRMIDELDRVRRHIRIFVNGEQVNQLSQLLDAKVEMVRFQALSGG